MRRSNSFAPQDIIVLLMLLVALVPILAVLSGDLETGIRSIIVLTIIASVMKLLRF